VEADFYWDSAASETHFSPHRFNVRALVFDPRKDSYAIRLEYRTAKKYDGLDSVERVQILKPEREEILRRLREK